MSGSVRVIGTEEMDGRSDSIMTAEQAIDQ